MNDNYIICSGITYSYGTNRAVDNVSFEIDRGDYLCILGENGTGKSTLVKLLLGLIRPDSGKIEYNIKNTDIGYLPQTTQVDSDFPASVYEVVMQGRCEKLGKRFFYSGEDKRTARRNIEILGIEDIADKQFSSLSGGQKQRVLLARALSAADKILLLDEPVSGLDPIVTDELYEIIRKLNSDMNISVVMVSHDTKTACKYANKILHLNKSVLFFGKTEDYVNTELYHQFLGGCGHEHH